MTSGKLHKKPSDLARDRLNARTRKTLIQAGKQIGKLTDSQKKTPSQLKSERARKKDLKRAGLEKPSVVPPVIDCRGCTDSPCAYNGDLTRCHHHSVIHRCKGCGQRVHYRWIEGEPFELCEVCLSRGDVG